MIDGVLACPVHTLPETVAFLRGKREIEPVKVDRVALFSTRPLEEDDYEDVEGQEQAKRALEIAAAGGHNILMVGPPGSGKTMLAERVPTILPLMEPDEVSRQPGCTVSRRSCPLGICSLPHARFGSASQRLRCGLDRRGNHPAPRGSLTCP